MGANKSIITNAELAELFSDGERLKRFYRFAAQNNHLPLHDLSQIIIHRPQATICFSMEEWNAMGRRITKGRKAIRYADEDGFTQFVFDVSDTHGETRYRRLIYPMKRLLEGLEELNGPMPEKSFKDDYSQIYYGVEKYLKDNGYFTDDKHRNTMLTEGIAYSLYCTTGFPKSGGIEIHGLPYSLKDNAGFVDEVYELSNSLQHKIEYAYIDRQDKIEVIEDTDEETISDEPMLPDEQTIETDNPNSSNFNFVEMDEREESNYEGYTVYIKRNYIDEINLTEEIYLGKDKNYNPEHGYDNSDNSLIFISNNPNIATLLSVSEFEFTQQELINKGAFSRYDYEEFAEINDSVLQKLKSKSKLKFGVVKDVPSSSVPFKYPNWEEEKPIPQATETSAEQAKFKPQGNTLYEKYMSVQGKFPSAVVIMRMGDFYEVMGDKARTVAEELDLTLTGRNVGLEERIPMCGFPYHITDKYIEKILEKHSVAVVDDEEEIKYIISHAETRSEQPQVQRGKLIDISDENDEDVFADNSEQLETERADEAEIYDEDEQYESEDEPTDDEEEESEVADIPQSKNKEQKGIHERKRKEKPKPTLFDYFIPEEKSLKDKVIEYDLVNHGNGYKFHFYDFYKTNPTIEKFATYIRKKYGEGGYGVLNGISQWHNSKGIQLKYEDKENPDNSLIINLKWKEVALRIADLIDDDEYLTDKEKVEYAHLLQLRSERANAKTYEEKLRVIARQAIDEGIQRAWRVKYEIQPYKFEESAQFVREHKAELEALLLEEKEIKAIHPTNFPYADNIFVEFYPQYCPRIKQNEVETATQIITDKTTVSVEEQSKQAFIKEVITTTDTNRKQRILAAYYETKGDKDFVDYVQNEYGYSLEVKSGCRVKYDDTGVWLTKYNDEGNTEQRFKLSWTDFATKIADVIVDDDYISLDEEEDNDWNELKRLGVFRPIEDNTQVVTPKSKKPAFNRFKELTVADRASFESYTQRPSRAPTNSMWGEVQSCTAIANGIYVVSTAGHGGIMISADLAPHLLSPEALQAGERSNGCYCYEEDADKNIPLRELYDKGILTKTNEYFTESYVRLDKTNPESKYVPFSTLTEEQQSQFFDEWDKTLNSSLSYWNKGYWQAHEQADEKISTELTPEQQKINAIVDRIVKEGTENTSEGNWIVYFDEFGEDEDFVREHDDKIATILEKRKEVSDVMITLDGFDTNYYLDFCPNSEWKEVEKDENTDLNGVLDQSELGGAKARFRGNIKAIELVKELYAQNRTPTPDEKKILASYVGWGGLSQAFDEHKKEWSKEYAELKRVLNADDYDRARGSVLNSHFTSKEVIEGIYSALNRFGVRGNNRILEPAMGTGNFFGFMPKDIADGAKLYGVELDTLTGRIAAKLYPQAKVQIKGYEDTSFANDSFDLVVGNVPFGGYSVYDSEYAKHNFYIHDYFLAKSIDKLKAGGLMAVVTSKGTMDKLNPSVRKYLAERAELLGAIRLPNDAFKQTAGTEVVTDILFFQKRPEKINVTNENTEWLSTGKTEEGFEINNYFIQHPEMVLGTMVREYGLYGAEDITVKSGGRDITEALNEAITYLPENIYTNPEYTEEIAEDEADYDVKPLCYKADGGRLFMRIGDKMVEQPIPTTPKDAYNRIKEMIELREELHKILDMQIQGCTDEQLAAEQKVLNMRYDRFVKYYGILNSQTNSKLFKDDGDSALLFACENLSEDKKTATKSDVFTKRTIRPYSAPAHTGDCFEALQISKNERGKVDISYIEELTHKDYETVISELGDAVFRNPEIVIPDDGYSGFETAEEYLSGNVVNKLYLAKSFAEKHPDSGYARNVTALERVQPTPLTASEISVRLGASWIGKEYYKQFISELLQIPNYYRENIDIFYNPHDSSWRVDKNHVVRHYAGRQATTVYGTSRADAFRLFEDSLNLRPTTIYDTIMEDGKEKRVVNQAETVAAREKQNSIQEEFKNWIFNDPERRESLERKYNALFNQIRLPTYDGSYLKFPEMNPAIELRPHQKNAVHRIITSPQSTLLHHVVGSGKTYTMAASVMKLRQYGLAKKPMIVVPNHILQQFSNEFRVLYPNAKILMATKEDLEKENRKKFVSRVAMGDWDAVIIAQSSFAKIPISQERQISKIQREIENIEQCIQQQWEENGFPRGAVKNLERIKRNREKQLKELLSNDKKDNVLTFENLGVDYLFVDEADCYKNLFLFTKMNNVAGISSAASQRASDLQLKCEYLQEMHGSDRGVVFATGTPISNSMTEMYTMQTYLQPSVLKDTGLEFFDNWAANFGETITALEMAPSGKGYKPRTRFAKFTNLPELLTMYRSFADVQTSDMVKLDVPKAERITVTLKPSETVVELAEEIAKRAERINDGGVNPHIDNMLKVTSDGKKLALDPRCYDAMVQDSEDSKLNNCAENVFEIWKDTTAERGTQLVFCDLSTPKCPFEDYEYGKDFDVYNDLKYKLVQMGIPEQEIVYIHEANSDRQKQALFDKVNAGTVRILIGSTEKCGAGTNVQKRIAALHHLDTPYRPRDLTQREGRAIRQGNTYDKVKIFTYVTERTFDSYSYQILENKQRFISQIDRGDLTVREAEDIDDRTLTYAEIKAITAANPKIKRKMEVDMEISKLRLLEGQYRKNLYALQDDIRLHYPERLHKQNQYLENVIADKKLVEENYNKDNFSINVNGTVYTEKSEGGTALMDALYACRVETVVAEYAGFKIWLNPIDSLTDERSITLSGAGEYTLKISDSAIGNIQRLEHFVSEFNKREDNVREKIAQLERDFATARQEVEKPFEHKNELATLVKEQAELNAELDLNKREEVIIEDNEDKKDSNGDDEVYKSISSENSRSRSKPRKHLNGATIAAYKKIQEKEPTAYIFIRNGSGYDLIGEQAKKIAQEKNLTAITEIVDNEQYPVVPVSAEETDRLIAMLVGRGELAHVIELEKQKKEGKKILNIPEEQIVGLLPDYALTHEDMVNFGYHDTANFLPLTQNRAKTLQNLGCDIFALYNDDSEGLIHDLTSKPTDYMFGIHVNDWNNALKRSEVRDYYYARLQIAQAAAKVANEDLNFVDERYVVEFIENNFKETRAISRVLGKETEQINYEKAKQYVPELIKEFTLRIDGEYLSEYGMSVEDIRKGIVSHISNETLKSAAEKYINIGKEEKRLRDYTRLHLINLLPQALGVLGYVDKPEYEEFDRESERLREQFKDRLPSIERITPYIESETDKVVSELKKYSTGRNYDYEKIKDTLLQLTTRFEETEFNCFMTVVEKTDNGKSGATLLHSDTYDLWYVLDNGKPKNEYDEDMDIGDKATRAALISRYSLIDEVLHHFGSEQEAREYYNKTSELTQMQFIDYLNVGLSEIKWLNGAIEGFDKDDITDIINDLKPHFEGSAFDESSAEVPFDEWYDEFAESTLKPELQERCRGDYSSVTKQGYEVKALYSDGIREHAIIYRNTVKDHAICYGYNRESGDWAQGNYDFKDFKTAEKNLYERYSELETYFRPENEPQPFATETKLGYDIEGMYSDGERNYAIIRRRKDYVIGIGYDNKTGEFEQGRYGFSDYNKAETYLDGIAVTEKDHSFKPNEPKNYMEIVRASVEDEYKAFYEYELTRSKEDLIATDNLKINFYNALSSFLGENIKDSLDDEHFEALVKETPYILDMLYDYYLGEEQESINTDENIAELIQNYNEKYHADIVFNDISKDASAVCYGIDENGTVYYFLPFLSNDKLSDIEIEAPNYVIASPETYLTNDELDEYKITFLKIGKHIQEAELKDMNSAVANMRVSAKRIERNKENPPIYYDTWKHAESADEEEDYRLSKVAGLNCKRDIQKAIKKNFDGSHLDTSFIDELIEKYGIERISHICATTITEKDYDGRFSRENKEWANSIRLSNEEIIRAAFEIDTHPAVLDGFVSAFRKKTKEIENKEENGMPENEQPKRNWLTIKVSHNALIHEDEKHKFMRMPPKSEYAGYAYNIYNNRIKESRQLVDMQSDGRELCYEINIPENTVIRLVKKGEADIELTATEFKEIVHGTSNKDYEADSNGEGREWINISVPQEAMLGEYEAATLFIMPTTSEHKGLAYYVPTSMVSEDSSRQDGSLILHLPTDFVLNLRERGKKDIYASLSSDELYDICNGATAEDYKSQRSSTATDNATENNGSDWRYVSVDKTAKIMPFKEQIMFQMPKDGEYAGYVYFVPKRLVKENTEKGTFAISIPPEYEVKLKRNEPQGEINLTPEEFIEAVKNRTAESYSSEFRKPSEEMVKKFEAVERNLRKNVPREMLERPNWVIVRTRKNEDTGRLDKFLISAKTGKFAESDNPETWTDFDTACKYAKENGGVALAYALDGKDKIACLDLDGCIQDNGDFTELAQKTFNLGNGTYCERSVSGKGLHIFAKTDGMDLRTFSKDGDMEYYRKSHFIAMTGDNFGSSELKSFDTLEMKSLLESKFEKRTAWRGTGKGVEGLSVMNDREVLEKAFASKNGSEIKRLYNGEDLKHNHSNSDMALITHLAFWCNGDKEQMLRIFATSGLYRPEKSADYYEGTLLKAIRVNSERYQPKKEAAANTSNNATTPKASDSGNSKA